ncbi:cytochrome C oxidase subunit II [Hyphomicrobium nitrativorans NL23]|uniref:Cytochrome c oxidase subunit 2 n=1 Tax=Hyphomicrobium nitrativorans NL23 TaxID=1029756 RepID=V5SAX0_9HYPH|nr:cytochrome c oxidase subunit II [Hyphomicrobium nitrativorans]AHB47961.1 cytochrome C oxidase subunit II [Hyphomicrobium nitrativorans NL23]
MLRWIFKYVPQVALAGLMAMLMAPGAAMAQVGVGQPAPKQIGMQEAVTPIAREIHAFHDLTNLIIIAIAAFVIILLLYVMFRFSEKRNPTPSKTTHHTLLELAWTVLPILILVVIAIPSFKLLMNQYTYPKPDLTIKAIGNSWFWEHEYPDHGNITITTNMLGDEEIAEREQRGIPSPRLLAVDNEIVVPVNKVVHVLVTANDVIHNWTVPSFGSKVDAVPGRVTSTWFKAEREGIYYGQCSELCGLNHAFMPIGVRVVTDDVFNQWVEALQARDRKRAREILDDVAIKQAAEAAGTATTVVSAATQAQ